MAQLIENRRVRRFDKWDGSKGVAGVGGEPADRSAGAGTAGEAAADPDGCQEAVPEPVGVPDAVGRVQDLELILVQEGQQRALWNELLAREHPRGAGPLLGAQLRYLVGSAHGWLGGLGFAAAALRLADRDCWIGWDKPRCRAHLYRVVGLARFLIRPSVRCRNLASRVLGEALRRLGGDFEARYGYRPWLVETFVETARHDGASLRASNWRVLGADAGSRSAGPEPSGIGDDEDDLCV